MILRIISVIFVTCCTTIFVCAQEPSASKQLQPSHNETLRLPRVSSEKLIEMGFDLSDSNKTQTLKIIEDNIEKIKQDIAGSRQLLAGRGGVDTGGGTIITSPTGRGLLDLYLYAPEIFADQKIDSSNIKVTKSLKILGVDLLINSQNSLIKKTEQQINKWKQNSPIMSGHLLSALKTLPLYYHNAEIISPPVEFYLPQNSGVFQNQLKMVALYVPEFGVHIGIKDLQSLPEKHQIALLIHESLRHLKSIGEFTFTNEVLQKITAEIMKGPEIIKTIDTAENLAGPHLLSLLERVLFFEIAEQTIVEFCNYFQKHKNDFTILNDSPDLQCQIDPKNLNFEEISERIQNSFSLIYIQPNLNEDVIRDLFSRFDLLHMKSLNFKLSSITGEMSYYGSYIQSRTARMHFDSVIDQVNASYFWANEQQETQFKREMNWYLNQANIKLSQ